MFEAITIWYCNTGICRVDSVYLLSYLFVLGLNHRGLETGQQPMASSVCPGKMCICRLVGELLLAVAG